MFLIVFSALDAGRVGLSMTYAMTLMGMFQWAVRQSAEVENQVCLLNSASHFYKQFYIIKSQNELIISQFIEIFSGFHSTFSYLTTMSSRIT